MTYAIDGKVGVDFTANTSNALFTVGTRVNGSDGTTWEYIQAGSDIAQYNWVVLYQNNSATATYAPQGFPLTITNAALTYGVGIAQVAITSTFYGWVCVNGNNVKGAVAVSCQPAAFLFATATAGIADDAITSVAGIIGAVAMTSAASASNVYVRLAYPHIGFLRGA